MSSRALVPLVALAAGTWLGLGRPGLRLGLEKAAEAATRAAALARAADGQRTAPAASPSVPALEHTVATDGALIPDPAPPFPQLDPEDALDRAWLVAQGPYHPSRDGRRLVAFTFDDGPSPDTAPTLLALLEEHGIRATFFFIGEYLVGNDRRAVAAREWARRIAAAGHYVGNHTFDHRRLTALSHTAALAEIDDAASAIEQATGARPWLFRPPYGALDPWLEAALRERRLDLLLWSIDVEDVRRSDPDEIARGLEEQLEAKQGGIVLLHDMHWPSIRAFARLLRRLEAHKWNPAHPSQRGWDVVDLGEYMRATAASPQPYATYDELLRSRRDPPADKRGTEL